MKKKFKICFLFIIIIGILMFVFNNYSLSFSVENVTGTNTVADNNISAIGQSAIKVLGIIGSIASVVFLVMLGIKYLLGSVEEKATYKKTMLPYFIGAFLVFAASTIASMIFNVAINL